MAANDDDVAEPASARQQAVSLAGIVGLDVVATETVTLLLELLGWSVAAASVVHDLPDRPFRLVLIDAQLFIARSTGSEPMFGNWSNIVLVGPPTRVNFISTTDARIFRADLPLDVAHLEEIIATVS